jgi:hypothetical protein
MEHDFGTWNIEEGVQGQISSCCAIEEERKIEKR